MVCSSESWEGPLLRVICVLCVRLFGCSVLFSCPIQLHPYPDLRHGRATLAVIVASALTACALLSWCLRKTEKRRQNMQLQVSQRYSDSKAILFTKSATSLTNSSIYSDRSEKQRHALMNMSGSIDLKDNKQFVTAEKI